MGSTYGTRLIGRMTAALMALLPVAGCTDSDYDLTDIDATVGIGDGRLSIPTSSTDNILLGDMLTLSEDDYVYVNTDGDYIFWQQGLPGTAARTSISPVTVMEQGAETYPLVMDFAALYAQADAAGVSPTPFTVARDVRMFLYEGEKPAEVVDLAKADVSVPVEITIPMDRLGAVTGLVKELTITFPEYVYVDNVQTGGVSFIKNDRGMTFPTVYTDKPLTIKMNITSLDFNRSNDRNILRIEGERIRMVGHVNLAMTLITIAREEALAMGQFAMETQVKMGEAMTITGGTGRFAPEVPLADFGRMEVTGVPDFLGGKGTVADIYNPQILLTIDSDMGIEAFAGGTLKAYKGRSITTRVSVEEMRIKASTRTTICVCRQATEALKKQYGAENVYETPHLSDLFVPMPDSITFEGSARANSNHMGTFRMGYEYSIVPQYRFEAPLALGERGVIVCRDSILGWNENVRDLTMTGETVVEMTADAINSAPAYVDITATAIDCHGNEMAADDISIETTTEVAAYAGEGQPSTTPITIRVRQHAPDALKRLDGLLVTSRAAATGEKGTITGVTFNARRHHLVLDNIKITVIGQLSADLN